MKNEGGWDWHGATLAVLFTLCMLGSVVFDGTVLKWVFFGLGLVLGAGLVYRVWRVSKRSHK